MVLILVRLVNVWGQGGKAESQDKSTVKHMMGLEINQATFLLDSNQNFTMVTC